MNIKKLSICLLFFLLLGGGVGVAQTRTVTGTIVDDRGERLPFVTVAAVGSTTGTVTDMDGRFSLTIPQETKEIAVSYIGFKRQRVTLGSGTVYNITMESEVEQLQQVVIVGNIERKKESFTGAFNTVGGGELRQMGSQNLVESLKSLDPSFVVLENMAMGANPNAMPNIQVRGQTSIAAADLDATMLRLDPNLPLFILDGFESTLQQIVDLDPNRIESVTVLKDAASTAFYGSRAANGVIVVTTIQGEPGRFHAFYTGDFSIQLPNLSSYNMMNAEEKLRFEYLSGRYTWTGNTDFGGIQQQRLDSLYSARLADVARGVNSYWMGDPLQVPFIQRHSLRFSGGSEKLMTDAGISYKHQPGVMKGSGRNAWSANLSNTLRSKNITVINRLELNGYKAIESPYGSFSTWVNANPYFRKVDSNGVAPRYLDRVIRNDGGFDPSARDIINPLYVASLNQINETTSTTIDERLGVIWNFHPKMKLEGRGQIALTRTDIIEFIPPTHPRYDHVLDHLKGRYTETAQNALNYNANLMYVYTDQIGKHNYIINARGEIGSSEHTSKSWFASGFAPGSSGYPSHADNFLENSRPQYINRTARRASFLVSGNYSWNKKYLFDATFRHDGSSVFGAARKFTPFWSAGVGWNLHEEPFFKQIRPINLLRLRATVGQTGNQNIESSNPTSIYAYLLGGNEFGQGLLLRELGNPNIEWQKTISPNLALDLNMFDTRLVTKFEIYQKRTNPMVLLVDQAPSTGAPKYPTSLGFLTYRGFEFEVSYAIIRTRNVSWRTKIMGAATKGVFSGFDNKLEGMDTEAQLSQALNRYRDGHSPKTLWAVRSLGIDPATGREIFLTKDGQPTLRYDPQDVVAVGMDEPKLMGTIQNFLTFKQFTITAIFRYALQHERFNDALFNKVENITMSQVSYNQDRRALYDRWQGPGDIAEFKAIRLPTEAERSVKSSRFIQTENYLSAESIGVTWRVPNTGWIKKMGLSSLEMTSTVTGTSGVFRLSNILLERGTTYPEATAISLSISAIF
jgi:TonB-linked SusC/RagA family outer membrane protein